MAGEDSHLAAESLVGEYRIKALVGEGAMGEVYLAQDLVLGRRVALKVLRRAAVDRDNLDRFLREARATAGFSHPHIVTLYTVGEHAGRPYLALEFLDGESLRTRCASGPTPEREALRIVRAIAEAVAEAHGHGIIHADLKPENVMVPRDGRVRVVDFGLSRLAGSPGVGGSGTPSYMAPEQWTSEPLTPWTDTWALGVILHELITGVRPLADDELARLAYGRDDPALPTLRPGWGGIVRDCLRRSPARRLNADAVVRALSGLLAPVAAASDDVCPFPGLTAFGRADSAHYFGRGSELDAALEALRRHPLVPVVGPSGIGKSSFVAAAVIPRLEESSAWTIVTCRPGSDPFGALATALARPGLASALQTQPARLALVLGEHAARTGRRVLLFIDQFEESFTLAADSAATFCTALALAAIGDEAWRIVLTLRDDFLDQLAQPTAMRPHLGALQVLGPMTEDDLGAAVRGPLRNVGYGTDPDALPLRIAADVVDQPASLALLQFACRALWERRDRSGRRLLTTEYEAMGGASGALAAHGERVLAELTPDQVRQVRALFLSLVGADGTRRPCARRVLEGGHLGQVAPLIELLLERRLVVVIRELDGDDPMIELAHEALSSAWPRLARWLDETHEQRLVLIQVEEAAALWQQRGRLAEETWSGGALAEAVRKIDTDWKVELPAESRRFLDAGLARTRRARLRRRWLVGMIGGLLIMITAAAIVAAIAAIAFARSERRTLAQQEMIKLAAADMGRFELRLVPFDWDPATHTSRPPSSRPPLKWQFRTASNEDSLEPGREFVEGVDLRRGTPTWRDGILIETVEARSGRVFLEIDRGPDCAPSLIVLQRLPGYTERDGAHDVTIDVPTCAATRSTMIDIPAGPFIRNEDRPDGTTFDEPAELLAFAIDRTEVTRSAFEKYGVMKQLTGDDAAPTGFRDDIVPPRPDHPVAGISFITARSYCRYLGKDLPSIDQWQKAFRGGLEIDGRPNPLADRLTTWSAPTSAQPANLAYQYPVMAPLAPVGTYPDDISPYGVLDLAGNVSEWTLAMAVGRGLQGLRVVAGSNWSTPFEIGHHKIDWRNSRHDRYLDFTLGIRCVNSP